MDASRECYCACHIEVAKLSTISAFGVWIRIECTQNSPDETTCGTCGRSGKDKYTEMSKAASLEFARIFKIRLALSHGDQEETLRLLSRVGGATL